MKALIVDDSSAMRSIISKIMSTLGFEIIEAANGQEALDQLGIQDDVSVVLLDWAMPIMDGLEFVRRLRQDNQIQSPKVVMVTTETERSRMAQALLAGVDEFVMKPFTKEALIGKLKLIGVGLPSVSEDS